MNKITLIKKVAILKNELKKILPKNIAVKVNRTKLTIYEKSEKSFNIRIDKKFKEDFDINKELEIIKRKINYIY